MSWQQHCTHLVSVVLATTLYTYLLLSWQQHHSPIYRCLGNSTAHTNLRLSWQQHHTPDTPLLSSWRQHTTVQPIYCCLTDSSARTPLYSRLIYGHNKTHIFTVFVCKLQQKGCSGLLKTKGVILKVLFRSVADSIPVKYFNVRYETKHTTTKMTDETNDLTNRSLTQSVTIQSPTSQSLNHLSNTKCRFKKRSICRSKGDHPREKLKGCKPLIDSCTKSPIKPRIKNPLHSHP